MGGGGSSGGATWIKPPKSVVKELEKTAEMQTTDARKAAAQAKKETGQSMVSRGLSGTTALESTEGRIDEQLNDLIAQIGRNLSMAKMNASMSGVVQPSSAMASMLSTLAQGAGQYLGMKGMQSVGQSFGSAAPAQVGLGQIASTWASKLSGFLGTASAPASLIPGAGPFIGGGLEALSKLLIL